MFGRRTFGFCFSTVQQQLVRVKYSLNAYQELNLNTFRSALAAYYTARGKGGQLVLTVDDIGEAEHENFTLPSLQTLTKVISWDEGIGNQFGEDSKQSHTASSRLGAYIERSEKMVNEGTAYRCFCSKERITQLSQTAIEAGRTPSYDGACRKLSSQQIAHKLQENTPYSIRLNVTDNMLKNEGTTEGTTDQTGFKDELQANKPLDSRFLRDAVLVKSGGIPTKFFMFAVDDIDLNISHVVRQIEWMKDAPKQMLVYKALKATNIPRFYHLPNMKSQQGFVFNPNEMYRKFRISELIKNGFSIDALSNYAMSQIWQSRQTKEAIAKQISNSAGGSTSVTKDTQYSPEVYSSDFLSNHFSLSEVSVETSAHDLDKMHYFNKYHIRSQFLPLFSENAQPNECKKLIKEFQTQLAIALGEDKYSDIVETSDRNMVQIIEIVTNRIRFWSDLKGYGFFFTDPDFKTELSGKAQANLFGTQEQKDKAIQILKDAINIFNKKLLDHQFHDSQINKQVYFYVEKVNTKTDKVETLNILRFALIGYPSFHPFGLVAQILGRSTCLKRLRSALKLLDPPAYASNTTGSSTSSNKIRY